MNATENNKYIRHLSIVLRSDLFILTVYVIYNTVLREKIMPPRMIPFDSSILWFDVKKEERRTILSASFCLSILFRLRNSVEYWRAI